MTATLNGPSSIAMIKMIHEKPVLTGNIPTEFIIKNEPNQIRAMMLDAQVDFAMIPSTMAALLYNRDRSYILCSIPVWGTLYLFGTDTSIHTWEDLRAKKISLMGRGLSPDIVFRLLAEKNGFDPDRDFILDYSFPGHIELANAIAAGVSDLGVISEPMVTLVMNKNSMVIPIFDLNLEWRKVFGDSIPFAQTALVVRSELAKKSPGLVKEYLLYLKESVDWVNQNPSLAADLIVRNKIMPDSGMAARTILRCNLHYINAFHEMKRIQEYLKVFYIFNPLITGGSIPDENFYFKEPAD
jgi:NitT/TauT family transport system substrate-binding protein